MSVPASARNIVTGTLTGYGLLGVNIVLGIYLMPFTMRHLGQAEYGLWMLVASMTAYFQLFDLGYGSGVVKHITAADARGDTREVNVVLSTFVVVYGWIAVAVIALTGLLIVAAVPRFPTLTPEQVRVAQYILGMLGVRIAIGFPMSIFGAITTARQRFALTGSIAIVVALLQGLATYAVLTRGYGAITLVATTTALNVLSYAAYAQAARRTFPKMHISRALFSGQHVREVTAFSFFLFLISIAIQVGTHVDNLIVGAYLGTSAVAIYTVAMRLSEYHRQLCGQFTGFLFPIVVRFHASRDGQALRATLLEGTRLGLGLACGVALGLVFFGRDLVYLWMGAGFEAAVVPLYVLALAGILMVAQGPTGNILLGTGRHRLVAGASMAEIALNVAITLALISRLGLTGAAIGTAVPFVLINVFLLIPIACRSVDVPLDRFFSIAVVPTIAALIPATLAGLSLRSFAAPASVSVLFLQAAMVGGVYLAAFWLIGLNPQDRLHYLTSVKGLRANALPQPEIVTS
ncbi:MAG: polysaccharide biosynthesis C-terminal domain-containing protein [Vicinamibacterales bacterium]